MLAPYPCPPLNPYVWGTNPMPGMRRLAQCLDFAAIYIYIHGKRWPFQSLTTTWPTAGRTSHPTGPITCKIQFWYIGHAEGPVLHSVAFSNASRCGAKKKKMKFGWLGAENWEFYSRRYFRQDIKLVKLSLRMSEIFFKTGRICWSVRRPGRMSPRSAWPGSVSHLSVRFGSVCSVRKCLGVEGSTFAFTFQKIPLLTHFLRQRFFLL